MNFSSKHHQLAQKSVLVNYISYTSGSLCSSIDPCYIASLVANANCRARALSFCIRHRLVPQEVKWALGGVAPSTGHCARMSRILRSEWLHRARIYRRLLTTCLQDPMETPGGNRALRSFFAIVDSSTEFLWQQVLQQLRADLPKRPTGQRCVVQTVGDAELSDDLRDVLSLGPKFAVEPKMKAPELLSLVRQVSRYAPEAEVDRCISEGVDVLMRNSSVVSSVPIAKVAATLRERSLAVLPADKEGGFVVLTKAHFGEKALEAITSVLRPRNNVSLSKLKSEGQRLCSKLNLSRLAKSVEKSKSGSLRVMFTAKSHKEGCPLRVIISENGTWQKTVALFLQEKLNLLNINDPFMVKNSDEIIDFLKQNFDKGFLACSVDIKDFIDCFGAVRFQNSANVTVGGFLELLGFYLQSTIAEWDEKYYVQKQGVCIGSCLGPVLSNLFLSHLDRCLADRLEAEGSLKNLNVEKCLSENTEKKKVAVIPYLHNTSHRLKKIAGRINVRVVLSAPNKMNRLCSMTNPYRKGPVLCGKQHRTPFVECAVGVVYEVPLSCGRQYIGQTGRCLNDRLREHRLNVSNHRDGHLSVHCHDCGCVPLFESCVVRARHREQLVREIMEAEMILRAGSTCVSVASLNLSDKESEFLGKAATRGR
ncbi:uncharacterized protein LOC144168094 [Haemaphysalis longicornis]